MEFKSISYAVCHVRAILKPLDAKFSVGTTPLDGAERMVQTNKMIFVRWTGGPSFNEVRDYLKTQNVRLHAGRGPVEYGLTRKGN